jgi:SAM-dependent methyltransferase/acyl carrier protein
VAYVVPDWDKVEETVTEDAGGWEAQHQDDWRLMYEETYGQEVSTADPTFNIIGWDSSYTGEAIPAEEMREWVEVTVDRIRTLRPRRVLEIGCGTGLLLARVAPDCERYVGTDFSPAALEGIEAMRQALPELGHVELMERVADDFTGIEAGSFDTVVINSVSQYLPTIDYLARVLEGAVEAVGPGGHVFVGDVRNLPLLGAFHTAIETYRSADDRPVEDWRDRAEQAYLQEDELVIDPAFFWSLGREVEGIGHVEVLQKRGVFHNELTQFRYDVVLHVGPEAGGAEVREARRIDGKEAGPTLEGLAARLAEEGEVGSVVVTDLPNARVREALEQLRLRRDPEGLETMAEVREAVEAGGIDPEDLWRWGEERGWRVEVSLAESGDPGRVDAYLTRGEGAGGRTVYPTRTVPERRALRSYATDPLKGKRTGALVPRVRQGLVDRLPEYMVPSAFVVLERIPLNPNGKVDRRALPEPTGRRHLEVEYAAPASEMEQTLATIWQEVLGIEKVGRHDNFFELGGHSLLATKVMSRVRESLGYEVPLRAVFEEPTLADLAVRVEAEGYVGRSRGSSDDLPVEEVEI